MPTTLGSTFGPDFSGRPPHMSSIDALIWRRWRPSLPPGVVALYFDVGLGLPSDLPQGATPENLLMWVRVNQKRADVLIEFPRELWLVELRHAATLNVIGRIQGYMMLWAQDPIIQKPLIPWVVSDRFDQDIKGLAVSLGINYAAV